MAIHQFLVGEAQFNQSLMFGLGQPASFFQKLELLFLQRQFRPDDGDDRGKTG